MNAQQIPSESPATYVMAVGSQQVVKHPSGAKTASLQSMIPMQSMNSAAQMGRPTTAPPVAMIPNDTSSYNQEYQAQTND